MNPPNAHDDYLDVRSAFKTWDKRYGSWGNAADAEDRNGDRDEKKARRAARRAMEALVDLRDLTQGALDGFVERGWGPPPKSYRDRKKCKGRSS